MWLRLMHYWGSFLPIWPILLLSFMDLESRGHMLEVGPFPELLESWNMIDVRYAHYREALLIPPDF